MIGALGSLYRLCRSAARVRPGWPMTVVAPCARLAVALATALITRSVTGPWLMPTASCGRRGGGFGRRPRRRSSPAGTVRTRRPLQLARARRSERVALRPDGAGSSITAVLVSWEAINDRAPAFYSLLLLLETGMLGVFAARDIILFYVFFEFTLIPLFFLVGVWGSEDRRYAAVKFFIFTFAGSLLTFLGLLAIVLLELLQQLPSAQC